jgi:hypothetical protein
VPSGSSQRLHRYALTRASGSLDRTPCTCAGRADSLAVVVEDPAGVALCLAATGDHAVGDRSARGRVLSQAQCVKDLVDQSGLGRLRMQQAESKEPVDTDENHVAVRTGVGKRRVRPRESLKSSSTATHCGRKSRATATRRWASMFSPCPPRIRTFSRLSAAPAPVVGAGAASMWTANHPAAAAP